MDKLKLIGLNLLVLSLIILSIFFFTNKGQDVQEEITNAPASSNDQYAYLTTANLENLDNLQPTKQIKPTGIIQEYKLEAKEADWEIMPGVMVKAITYNGQVPGPAIEVTEGDLVRITLKNNLKLATSIHWHGMHLPNKEDGVPDVTQKSIQPGQSYTYEFLAGHAGTYMYHPHINSVKQIDNGLYGAFIIRPQDTSNQPNFDKEYTFIFGGWNVTQENIDRTKMLAAMTSTENQGMEDMGHAGMVDEGEQPENSDGIDSGMSMGGMNYNFWTINGKAFPATPEIKADSGDRIRIRLINISNNNHPMHLHGTDFRVIAEDGHPLTQPKVLNTIDVAPGKTLDIEFLADNPGNWIFHCHELHHTENDGVEPGGLLSIIKVGTTENKDNKNESSAKTKEHNM